jgi:sugar phosphate permease
VAVTGAAVWAVVAVFFSVVPSFATERFGTHNLAVLGAISSIVLICSSAAQVASRERLAPGIAQVVGLVLLTAGLAALALASVTSGAFVLILASALAGTGHGLGFLGAQDDLNRIAPPERRGEINAALYTCIYLGIALPVIGVGVVADLSTLTTAVVVFSFATGAAAVAAALWHVAAGRAPAPA